MSKVLARSLAEVGEPFPFPYLPMANIHRGDLVELLAAPKVGKSMLALNAAVGAAERGVPVLYHSSDTRLWAQAARVVSILTGETTRSVEERRDYWSGWLEGVGLPLRWSSAAVWAGNFQELLDAEREFLGEYPGLVIVDVVADLVRNEEDINRAFRTLHACADRTGATIFALHHVKRGDAADGNMFVSMTDGVYGGERIAEIVITLWKASEGRLACHLAKNRQGIDGKTVNLPVDYSRAKVGV